MKSPALMSRMWGMRRSPLVRQSGARIAARIIASALQAFGLLVLARALGVAQFGLFTVGVSLGYVIMSITTWGAQYRVLRSAAESDPLVVRATLLILQVGAVAVLAMISSGLLGLQVLPIASFAGLTVAMVDQLNAFGQFDAAGAGSHRQASVMAVQQRALPAVALVATLGQFTWVPFLLATTLTIGQPLAFSFLQLRPFRPDRHALRGGSGYWVYGMAQNAPQLEAPLLGLVASSSVAGLYGVANRLANPLTILSSALASIFIPEIARAHDKKRRVHLGNRLIAVSVAYAVLVSACAVWIAPLVVLLTGRTFAAAEPLIASTTVAAGLSAVSQAFNAILIADGRPIASSMTLGIGTCVSLGGLAIFASVDSSSFLWIAPLLTQVVVLTLFAALRRRDSSAAVTTLTRRALPEGHSKPASSRPN